MLLCVCLALGACSAKPHAVGHAKRALEPGGFPQSVSGKTWEAAAVRAAGGAGAGADAFDYSPTRLLPVLLVLRNTGQGQPQVILEDVRGVAGDAEYLVYTADEGLRLATDKPLLKKAANTASSGFLGAGIGAALGAGAGTLVYALGGLNGIRDANLIWQASAAGGAAGGILGAASSSSALPKETVEAVRADLASNVWQEDPITPGTTRMGYLLLPEGLGIRSVRITVRDESGSETRILPIAQAKDYNPEQAKAKAAQAAHSASGAPKGQAAPMKGTEPDLHEPKRVPPPMEI